MSEKQNPPTLEELMDVTVGGSDTLAQGRAIEHDDYQAFVDSGHIKAPEPQGAQPDATTDSAFGKQLLATGNALEHDDYADALKTIHAAAQKAGDVGSHE